MKKNFIHFVSNKLHFSSILMNAFAFFRKTMFMLNKQHVMFLFFVIVVMLSFYKITYTAVLFEDNFNNQPDWQPRPGTNDTAPAGAMAAFDFTSSSDLWQTPAGWSYFRATGLWCGPDYEDTIRITNQADHDNSGKALIIYNEANFGASGDGWGADAILTKLFNRDYQELYVRLWIRTQEGWRWPITADQMIKMFRVIHFDMSGSIYLAFPSGNLAPVFLWDFKHSNTYGTRYVNAIRCDPQETDYYAATTVPGDAPFVPGNSSMLPTDTGMLADTNWHRLDFHVKMNSFNAGNSTWNTDGVYEFFYDNELLQSINNVQYKFPGSDPAIGWNGIGLGGNAYSSFLDTWFSTTTYAVDNTVVYNAKKWKCIQENINIPPNLSTSTWANIEGYSGGGEQWYAIDDVVISDSPIPADYVIVTGTSNCTFISAPNNLQVK